LPVESRASSPWTRGPFVHASNGIGELPADLKHPNIVCIQGNNQIHFTPSSPFLSWFSTMASLSSDAEKMFLDSAMSESAQTPRQLRLHVVSFNGTYRSHSRAILSRRQSDIPGTL